MSGPAVIDHSCCGVPANVLSVCLFFFGEANKIIIKKFRSQTSPVSAHSQTLFSSARWIDGINGIPQKEVIEEE